MLRGYQNHSGTFFISKIYSPTQKMERIGLTFDIEFNP